VGFSLHAAANLHSTFSKQPDSVFVTLAEDSVSINDSTVSTKTENKRLIAAILAFPLPFGIMGLHRIYLGTAPWVPFAYFITAGGFGGLALIDFIYIISCSDEEFAALDHNEKLFFWVK
jgi:TM2 domain-containing membrane protein YozV